MVESGDGTPARVTGGAIRADAVVVEEEVVVFGCGST
jgi:hypothetical protein